VCEDLRQICVNLNTSEALEQICMLFLFFVCLWWLQKKQTTKNGQKLHTQSHSGNGAYEYFRLLPSASLSKTVAYFFAPHCSRLPAARIAFVVARLLRKLN